MTGTRPSRINRRRLARTRSLSTCASKRANCHSLSLPPLVLWRAPLNTLPIPCPIVFEVPPSIRRNVLHLLRTLARKRLAFPGRPKTVLRPTTLASVLVTAGKSWESNRRQWRLFITSLGATPSRVATSPHHNPSTNNHPVLHACRLELPYLATCDKHTPPPICP